jgi:hypothetical protein
VLGVKSLNLSGLRYLRDGGLFLPIAGMALAPLPHPLHRLVAAVVIPVGAFTQPAALERGFSGPPTLGSTTVKLGEAVAVVREKELPAMTALAVDLLQTHRAPKQPKPSAALNQNPHQGRRANRRRKKRFFG